jgi:O-antigen/teichoic acid export membrane protein
MDVESIANTKGFFTGPALARNTFLNLIGQLVPMAVGVVAIPILISHLGAERFAVITIAWMLIGYFSLFDLGLGRALTQLIAERIGNINHKEIPGIFWTSLALMLALSVAGAVIIALFASPLVYTILKVPAQLKSETVTALYVMAASLPLVIMTAAFTGTLTAYHRFGIINAIRIPTGIYTFTAPLLVLPFSNSTVPIVVALFAGKFFSFNLHLYYCLKVEPGLRANIVFEVVFIRPLFRFGGWMSVSNILGPLMVYFDRFLVASIVSMAAVAYYSIPYEFITKLWIIPGALMTVLFPAFASTYRESPAYTADLFKRAVKYQLLGIFPFVFIIVALAHEGLAFWIGNSFADNSYRVLQWLAIGVFVNCLAQVPFTFLQGIGKPDVTSKLHVMELAVYLPTLWVLVKSHGITGAAIAWSLRIGIDTILLFSLSRRFLRPLSDEPNTTGYYMIAAVVLLVCFMLLPRGVSAYVVCSITLMLFMATGWKLLLSVNERAYLMSKISVNLLNK